MSFDANQYLNQKVLITTSQWFYGPDGKQYRGVYGTLKAIQEAKDAFGFVPNRSHANWFYQVGSMFIMGCQVQYLIRTDQQPSDKSKHWTEKDGVVSEYEYPSVIFITD